MALIWIVGAVACMVIPAARKWNTFGDDAGHMGFDTGLIYVAVWSVACAGFALAFVLTGTPEASIAVVIPLLAAAAAGLGARAIRRGDI